LNGNQKKTDLMQTHFIFDSRLEYAIPLSDSVLGFHKHGIQVKEGREGVSKKFFKKFLEISEIFKVLKIV